MMLKCYKDQLTTALFAVYMFCYSGVKVLTNIVDFEHSDKTQANVKI